MRRIFTCTWKLWSIMNDSGSTRKCPVFRSSTGTITLNQCYYRQIHDRPCNGSMSSVSSSSILPTKIFRRGNSYASMLSSDIRVQWQISRLSLYVLNTQTHTHPHNMVLNFKNSKLDNMMYAKNNWTLRNEEFDTESWLQEECNI